MESKLLETLSERGLERRLKRHFLKETQSYFAACAPGFEALLETELSQLPDLQNLKSERGGVAFEGTVDSLYLANLHLRTAHRVLLRLDEFLAQSYPMLFNAAKKIPWELYLGFNKNYSVQVSAKTSRLRHHKNIAKTLHDAILARMEPLGLKPEQLDDTSLKSKDDTSLEFHLRFFEDRCTLSLNTSGEHLHKRGYRKLVSEAPLRETLTSSILVKANALNYQTLIDPMCGSGTLLIEALELATNKAPGRLRPFAFEALPAFQSSKWERFKREAVAHEHPTDKRFIGLDIEPKNIAIAKQNALNAGYTSIDFRQGDATRFLETLEPATTLIVSNLPYGERLGDEDSSNLLLKSFARHLKTQYQGCHFAFICKHLDWLKEGFALNETLSFSNGGLKVFLALGMVA